MFSWKITHSRKKLRASCASAEKGGPAPPDGQAGRPQAHRLVWRGGQPALARPESKDRAGGAQSWAANKGVNIVAKIIANANDARKLVERI